ncbi:MAG TPA: DUF493 family protein [Brumimicrobium sp.]|nr:DUF493 family protein [Brumimicrobium sp.]
MGQFDELKSKLELEEWPNLYFFKFIMPSDNQKIALVSSLFDDTSDIQVRPSSKGNYTSISVKEMMFDANSIIDIYEKAALIEGVIIL